MARIIEPMHYPDGYPKSTEQPMRNRIKVLDRDVPPVRVIDLEAGQMFRYPRKTNPENLYMKVTSPVTGMAIVLLATGGIYTDYNPTMEVEVVDAIEIVR